MDGGQFTKIFFCFELIKMPRSEQKGHVCQATNPSWIGNGGGHQLKKIDRNWIKCLDLHIKDMLANPHVGRVVVNLQKIFLLGTS